jgi:hypothetical protein
MDAFSGSAFTLDRGSDSNSEPAPWSRKHVAVAQALEAGWRDVLTAVAFGRGALVSPWVDVTLSIYAHTGMGDQEAALRKLGDAFGSAG